MLPGKFHCWHVEASRVTWSNWVKLSSGFWALPYTRKNMEKKQQALTRPNQNCKLNTQGFPIRIARFTFTLSKPSPHLLSSLLRIFLPVNPLSHMVASDAMSQREQPRVQGPTWECRARKIWHHFHITFVETSFHAMSGSQTSHIQWARWSKSEELESK